MAAGDFAPIAWGDDSKFSFEAEAALLGLAVIALGVALIAQLVNERQQQPAQPGPKPHTE